MLGNHVEDIVCDVCKQVSLGKEENDHLDKNRSRMTASDSSWMGSWSTSGVPASRYDSTT